MCQVSDKTKLWHSAPHQSHGLAGADHRDRQRQVVAQLGDAASTSGSAVHDVLAHGVEDVLQAVEVQQGRFGTTAQATLESQVRSTS